MILIDTVFKLESVKDNILKAGILGVDIETYDYKGKDFGIIRLVQLAVEDEVYVFDLRKAPFPDYLKEVFKSREKIKVFHNGFFDMTHLIKEFDCVFENTFCTYLASHMLSCGLKTRHSLKHIAKVFLDEDIDKTEQKSDWGGELTESQIAYASKDASILLKLYRVLGDYIKRKGLNRISSVENAIQRINARNFAKRFIPDNSKVSQAMKEIEQDYFRGLSIEEIGKAKRLPEFLKDKFDEYNLLREIKEKGFYPKFRSNWEKNGFFFQTNYYKPLKGFFDNVFVVNFNNLELPALHSNAKDFKSYELYSNPEFLNTRECILLKGVGLKNMDILGDYFYLARDFEKKIPGIIRWHKRVFSLLAARKPVRVASGKIIHTKNYMLEEKEGFIEFLIEATISDFVKGVIALIEKQGGRVLQFNALTNSIEAIDTSPEAIENAIQTSSKIFFSETLFPHFYQLTEGKENNKK